MGKIGKRVLSAVVALVMCIAVLPTNISFAATDVYTKVTSADDIVDGGKYVLATLYGKRTKLLQEQPMAVTRWMPLQSMFPAIRLQTQAQTWFGRLKPAQAGSIL